MQLPNALSYYAPRECDCMFCKKHGAAYLSDKNGTLKIQVKEKKKVNLLKNGSRLANFILCSSCGVLAAVSYDDGNKKYAAINTRALEGCEKIKKNIIVSPEKLSPEEKVSRWKEIWFNDVGIAFKENGHAA
jgi:hypothetical protein